MQKIDCFFKPLFLVGLDVVEAKTRYGFDWFEAKWRETFGETGQERLFD